VAQTDGRPPVGPASLGTMEDIYAQIAATAPLGRLCTPEDVAAAVAFFVSSDGGYVTGKITQATGGTFHQNLGRK